ncbi:Copia protein [Gossypium australe]|uniref:Copia protein n=1 Tax=Gossypium australe TaxID=47621 RepID=A0A5B6W5T5_9ROSI|nr:Copia protein [Gossypium australe]
MINGSDDVNKLYQEKHHYKTTLVQKNLYIENNYVENNLACVEDCRPTSCFCIYLGGNLMAWRSKKQNVVSRSTAEAEYKSLANAVSEGITYSH